MKSIKVLCLVLITFWLGIGCNIFQANEKNSKQIHRLGLSGVFVQELHLTNNYLYAAAGESGLYRIPRNTTDSTKWEYLGFRDTVSARGITSVYYDPIHNHLWVANNSGEAGKFDEGIYRSTDGGESWHAVDNGLNHYQGRSNFILEITAPVMQPDQIYASSLGTVYKYNADSSRWTNLNAPRGGMALAVNVNNTEQIWVGGHNTFGRGTINYTNNGGKEWINVVDSLFSKRKLDISSINDITIDSNDSAYIALSANLILKINNDLTKWTKFFEDNTALWVDPISVNRNNPTEIIVHVGPPPQLMITKNSGNSWRPLTNDTLHSVMRDMAVDWEKGSVFAGTKGLIKIDY